MSKIKKWVRAFGVCAVVAVVVFVGGTLLYNKNQKVKTALGG